MCSVNYAHDRFLFYFLVATSSVLEPHFNIKTVFPGVGILTRNIWQSLHRLIFMIGIHMLCIWHLYIETARGDSCDWFSLSRRTSNRKMKSRSRVTWLKPFSITSKFKQVPRQQRCRDSCRIFRAMRSSKIQSRGFETSRDLSVRRLVV